MRRILAHNGTLVFVNNPVNLGENFFLNDLLVFDMSAVNQDSVVACIQPSHQSYV